MPFDDFGSQRYPLFGWDIRQPNQSGVRQVVQVDQLSEVGIYSNQYPVRRFRQFQQGPVPGIRAQGARLDHIMSTILKPLCQPASGAPVYEEPHAVATETGARVSPAITMWA